MKGEYGVYLVTGKRRYRTHAPGTTFEAALDPGPEQRAIERGDIRLIKRVIPALVQGTFKLPDDWPPSGPATAQTEPPQGGSLVSGGR